MTVRLDEEFTADGCVRRKDLQFLTDLPACHPSVQRFVRVLEALNVGPVETLEAGDADRRE
ncbi:MAG: hypothetical protein KY476_14005 [Planctomycetes bacterium]|nr:hypothetical protein [Planctomycetota bacterium]